MKRRFRHIKAAGVFFLIFLHVLVISGEYRTHEHHLEKHHSEILTVLDCEFGNPNSVKSITSNGSDEIHHDACCFHNEILQSNLPDKFHQNITNVNGSIIGDEVANNVKFSGKKLLYIHNTNLYKTIIVCGDSNRAPPIC